MTPKGQTTSRPSTVMHQLCKKMASFPVDLLCSFVFVFIPWWVSSISWIRTEGAWDVAAEVLCCLLPMKKLSLTEVISFVLQPLYNTHNSLSHMEWVKNILHIPTFFCYNHFKMYFKDRNSNFILNDVYWNVIYTNVVIWYYRQYQWNIPKNNQSLLVEK